MIIQDLSGKEIPHGLLREVKVVQIEPLKLSVTILSEDALNENDFKEIKREIEEKIGRTASIELTLGVQLGEPITKAKE